MRITTSIDDDHLTRFNKIAIGGTPQMAADSEANILSRVYAIIMMATLDSTHTF